MASLVTPEEVRDQVDTDLDDTQLQRIIDDLQAEAVEVYGAPYDGVTTVTETLQNLSSGELYTRRKIGSVSSITEARYLGGSEAALSTSQYYAFGKLGRIDRLPAGSTWGRLVTVTYIPTDDRAVWRQVLIDLVRLTLERTAVKSMSVAGEYSVTAPDDWEHERKRIMRRLGLPSI